MALQIILLQNTLIEKELNKASRLPKSFVGLLIENLTLENVKRTISIKALELRL